MKGTFLTIILLIGIGNIFAQEITVRSEKNPDIDFGRYKTYYWSSQVDQELDEGLYFLNDLILKADVRDAVRGELEGRGYRIDKDRPDLIVNFRVFDRQVTLRGYDGYGSTYWGTQEYSTAGDLKSIDVEAGTVIISLLDKSDGVLVWQGFASGLINENNFIKDEGKIREAVSLIFEDYGIRANEYTKR